MHYPQENNDKRLIELLEKWQSGDFTKQNEQELQSLTATDAFRREAVEGYLSVPEADHTQALDQLREKIRKKSDRNTIIPINRWMAIAAALVLCIGAVWFLGIKKLANETSPMAQSLPEKDGQQEAISPAPPPPPDSEASSINDIIATPTKSAPKLDPMTKADKDYAYQEQRTTASPPSAPSVTAPVVQDEVVAATQSDREQLGSTDALQSEEDAAPVVAKEQVEAKRKAVEKSEVLSKKASKQNPPGGSISGVNTGYVDFQRYLRDNARLTNEAKNNNVSGYVTVRFTLNSANTVSGINVVKSLGFGCDQEAIRLVRAYGWTQGRDTTLTIDVPFVR